MKKHAWTGIYVVVLYGILLAGLQARDTATLTAAQAAKHIGETATVCGIVASAKYASSSRGQPTFLNLDKPYPNHVFTALIWGDNRSRFEQPPEQAYGGQDICVSGAISSYRGKPQIIVSDPSQIKLQ